jgi:hypothetical protein
VSIAVFAAVRSIDYDLSICGSPIRNTLQIIEGNYVLHCW